MIFRRERLWYRKKTQPEQNLCLAPVYTMFEFRTGVEEQNLIWKQLAGGSDKHLVIWVVFCCMHMFETPI